MSDDIFRREIQSVDGARTFGRVDGGTGNLAQAELVKCSLMKMIGPDGHPNGKLGVTKEGARFVCALPPGYDHNVGILPQDGRLLVTHPNMPALIVNCETGVVRRL